MKLKVKKDRTCGDGIHVEITTDTAKKPIVFDLTPDQVQSLFTLLQTTARLDKMDLEITL